MAASKYPLADPVPTPSPRHLRFVVDKDGILRAEPSGGGTSAPTNRFDLPAELDTDDAPVAAGVVGPKGAVSGRVDGAAEAGDPAKGAAEDGDLAKVAADAANFTARD